MGSAQAEGIYNTSLSRKGLIIGHEIQSDNNIKLIKFAISLRFYFSTNNINAPIAQKGQKSGFSASLTMDTNPKVTVVPILAPMIIPTVA